MEASHGGRQLEGFDEPSGPVSPVGFAQMTRRGKDLMVPAVVLLKWIISCNTQ